LGFRLSKIYTKTGDKGNTSLAFGDPIHKGALIIECLGNIDELNSLIGCTLSKLDKDSKIYDPLIHIQHQLFNYGAELALPQYLKIDAQDVTFLENHIDHMNTLLPPLKEFILPGGTPASADCFFTRAYARKAERNLARLQQESALSETLLQYINRLSDFLFVAARYLNKESAHPETYWQSQRLQKNSNPKNQ
jgi:cob(I)alamin adenosyltransferase